MGEAALEGKRETEGTEGVKAPMQGETLCKKLEGRTLGTSPHSLSLSFLLCEMGQ